MTSEFACENSPWSGLELRTAASSGRSSTTLVITRQTGPGRERALGIVWAKGDVPPCHVVDARPGSGPLGGPPPAGASTQTSQG